MHNHSETVSRFRKFEQKFDMNAVCLRKFSFLFLSFSQNSRALCKKKIKKFYFCYMSLLYYKASHLGDGIC